MPSLSKSRFNSRSSLKSSLKSSNTGESSNGIWIVLGLLVLLIVVVIIVGAFYKRYEKFTNQSYRLEYYYMTTCPHCKDFDPIWEKLTTTEKENLNSMGVTQFAKYELNGSKPEETAKVEKYKVTGAPTIILVDTSNDDKYYIYDDNRSVNDIKEFIAEKTK